MKEKHIDVLTYKFHEFESKVIKSEDWEKWDAVRFNIYYKIQHSIFGGTFESGKPEPKPRNYLSLMKEAGKFLIQCIKSRKKNIIFAASRFKDNNGNNYDPNIIDIYNIIKDDCIVLDSMNLEGPTRYPMVFNRWVSLTEKIKRKNTYSLPSYILDEIHKEFGMVIPDDLINKVLVEYYSQKAYYYYLFKILKPKRIYLDQNGIQKGLFRIANDMKIPVVELQHGIIYYSHFAYSYPSNVNKNQLSLPDYFCVYSEFWKNKVVRNFPVEKIIVLGNSIASEIRLHPIRYALTFITTSAFTPRFIEIIKQLRSSGYNKPICLKLHPHQRNEVDSIKKTLNQFPNVDVVYVETSMKDIIGMSESLLTIQSTSAYEVLDAGKRLYILMEMWYENHRDIFNNPLVELIENTGQLLASLNQSKPMPSVPHSRYFEPFHKERFEEVLN